MFVSVKERARQIANGQFIAPTTSSPVTSLIDVAPEFKPNDVATPKQTGTTESHSKPTASPLTTKSLKAASLKKSTPKAVAGIAAPPAIHIPKNPSQISMEPSGSSTIKKSSSKSRMSKDSAPKLSSPKIGSPKSASTKKISAQTKLPSSAVVSPTRAAFTAKPTISKPTPTIFSKSKRSKSPPKRVDSPVEDDEDPLWALKAACLKQVSSVTGLGGRRLAVVLRQRSSGGWYAALKDTGSDKYLKMWMNKDKLSATKEEALETYLQFVTKARNEVRWFPISPRASSPKGKGK
ncbi:hypothetical protein B5807_06102 [Epicoccum nigrum]|uniref:Uncharacterized protein n=1 Tax=Epicoccum nigrum TaxID=105696 RepID=A0A1Y2M0I4_EPING|nr:hypothetical protein B5807_06102 [Epicoccum nigrum]